MKGFEETDIWEAAQRSDRENALNFRRLRLKKGPQFQHSALVMRDITAYTYIHIHIHMHMHILIYIFIYLWQHISIHTHIYRYMDILNVIKHHNNRH